MTYDGLTVECCKKVEANYILSGIRYVNDFEYEKAIADMNRSLDGHIETIFLTCLPKYTSVASTLVRDVIRNGGDVSQFVPDVVLKTISQNSETVISSINIFHLQLFKTILQHIKNRRMRFLKKAQGIQLLPIRIFQFLLPVVAPVLVVVGFSSGTNATSSRSAVSFDNTYDR